MSTSSLVSDNFTTFTIGILVYFTGMILSRRVVFMREFNILEPVTGCIIASLIALAFFFVANVEITFEQSS